jgi:hypothetical protein
MSTPTRGTRFVWMAAGCPTPVTTDGAPILPRDLRADAERERRKLDRAIAEARGRGGRTEKLDLALAAVVDAPVCAACGEAASYRLDDAISDNFTTVKNASRAWPFPSKAVCTGCLWAARTVALRCALWFARLQDEHGPGGVWFVSLRPVPGWPSPKPDALSALLAPPPPPFVAGLPLYGVDHGGEANAHRAIWPWTEGESVGHPHPRVITPDPPRPGRLFLPADPLIKLQSKHTALYAEVSHSAERYRLQVDDAGDVTVDVPLWRALRQMCEELLLEMRGQGVGAQDAKAALTTLRPPFGFSIGTADWRARVRPLHPHTDAAWWPLFVNLLPMPALVKRERGAAASV